MNLRETTIQKMKKMQKEICESIDRYVLATKAIIDAYKEKDLSDYQETEETSEQYRLMRIRISTMCYDPFMMFKRTLTYGYHLKKELFDIYTQTYSTPSGIKEYWLEYTFGKHDYETTMKVIDGLMKAFEWGKYANKDSDMLITFIYNNSDNQGRMKSYMMNKQNGSNAVRDVLQSLFYVDKVGDDYDKWFFTHLSKYGDIWDDDYSTKNE